MPRLLNLQGDAEGRVACSECIKRWGGRLDYVYLFEMPHQRVGQYELRGKPESYQRREASPARPPWESFPNEGDVTCASCRMSAHVHVSYSLATGMATD